MSRRQPSGTSSPSRPAYSLYRLQYDLAQLADELPAGIRAVANDADMSKFCLILEPQDGYLKGCRIHISVEVPLSWPCVPLAARIDTPFAHPNVFGSYICCDILKTDNELRYYRDEGYKGGYTPAYSLIGTFMQLASFFSGENVEQDGGYVLNQSRYRRDDQVRQSLLEAAGAFVCNNCLWNCEAQVEVKRDTMSAVAKRSPVLVPGSRVWSLAKAQDDITRTVTPEKQKRSLDFGNVDTSSFQNKIARCWILGRAGSLDSLNNDILLHVIRLLDTSSLLVFGSLYPRFGKLLEETNEIARRDIRCYITKRDQREVILGIGLKYDQEYKAFFSSFDYVSQQAFDDLAIRKGSANDSFGFWMPLAINDVHYRKASDEFQKRLSKLNNAAQSRSRRRRDDEPRRLLSHDPVRHLIAMANALVVDFMKVCDASEERSPNASSKPSSVLRASERALAGYCSIIHLLASYALENKRIINGARGAVKSFLTSRSGRSKTAVPDLGQFIVMLCLVDGYSWLDVRRAVVDELFTRFVIWQLQPKPTGAGLPGLAYLESSNICEWRLRETFHASRTGLRLLLFQVFFMEKLAKRKDWTLKMLKDDFDSRHGLPPPGLTTELLERIQFIYKMDNLGTFAKELGAPAGKEGMTKFLRERITESLRAGYHQSTDKWPRERLLGLRARDDKVFSDRLKQIYGRDMAASNNDQPSFFPGDDNRQVVRKQVVRANDVSSHWVAEETSSWDYCDCELCSPHGW